MEFHPIADVFPLMSDEEFTALCQDIKANGLAEPIITYEGRILDGRNRFRACKAVGVTSWMEAWDGTDPFAYVLSKNLIRRHLDASQRAMVAARMAKLKHGENKGSANLPIPTQPEAAKALHVSARSVGDARKVQERADPEMVAQVDAGNIAVSAAAEVATMPKAAQKRVASAAKEGGKKAAAVAVKEEKAKAEPVPLDDIGIPIQKHAAEAFEAVPKFEELLSLLRKADRLYSEIADMPGGAYLQRPGVSVNARERWKHKGIQTAILNVADCKPSLTACPYTMAENHKHDKQCTLCHGLNWTRPIGKDEAATGLVEKLKEKYCG